MSGGAAPPGTRPRPVPKAPFLPDDRFRIRRIGAAEPSELTVYLFRDVAEELIFASRFRPAQTSCGILTGGYYTGPAGTYIEVRGFRDSLVVDSVHEFALSLRTRWPEILQDADLAESALLPLGWFVSRPHSNGRPGPFEVITHLTYFNLACHVFVVLDPATQQMGLYRQVDDGAIANIGFNLIEATTAPDPPATRSEPT